MQCIFGHIFVSPFRLKYFILVIKLYRIIQSKITVISKYQIIAKFSYQFLENPGDDLHVIAQNSPMSTFPKAWDPIMVKSWTFFPKTLFDHSLIIMLTFLRGSMLRKNVIYNGDWSNSVWAINILILYTLDYLLYGI